MAQRENYFPVAPRKFSQLHLLRLRFANRAFSRLETCSLLLFNKGTMAGGTCTGWQYTFKPPKIFRELHHVFTNLPPGLLTKRGSVAIPGPPSPNTSVPCQVEQLSPIPRKAWSFNETSYPSCPVRKKMSIRWTNSKESGERHCPTHCLRFLDSPE